MSLTVGHYAPDILAPGGVSNYIRRLGEAQAARGDRVYYFSRKGEPTDPSDTFIRVADEHSLFSRARAIGLDILHLHKPIAELPERLVPTLRTMHDNTAACPSGSRYLERPNCPCNRPYTIAGCLWGHVVDHCGSRHPRNILRDFKRIHQEMEVLDEIPTLAVSQFLKDWMVRTGYNAEYIHVIHSPAPPVLESFVPLPVNDPPRFVFMGRLVPHKGLDWLLRAAAEVNVALHIDVAGEGEQESSMRKLARDLGIADNVTFHGWLDTEPLKELILRSRAVVFPSVWHEPAGLVSLEAAAYGRPLIASRVGGIPEYTSPENALLIPPRSIEELARAITYLSTHPEEAEQMGRRGMNLARTQFTMEDFLQALYERYAAAIEQQASAPVVS